MTVKTKYFGDWKHTSFDTTAEVMLIFLVNVVPSSSYWRQSKQSFKNIEILPVVEQNKNRLKINRLKM